jgi:hypothetical protein
MRGFKAAAAVAVAFGLVAFSGAAWAIVSTDTQNVPVSDSHGPVPSGTIELRKTTGETIAKVPVKDGVAQIPKDEKIDRKTKIIVVVHNDKTNETTEKRTKWGALLNSGINTATIGAAARGVKIAENETPRPTDRVYFSYNYYVTVGVGATATHNESTGAFFGPGAGMGVSLTNSTWQGSVDFTGGIFNNFAPGWYGGVLVDVFTPPFSTATETGSTNTGIPVTSKINEGMSVDVLGRVGTITPVREVFGFEKTFLDGGLAVTHFSRVIMASTVGDNFQESKNLTAPVAGGGFGFCPFGAANDGMCTGPEVDFEYHHIFFNSSELIGVTPASSGKATIGGQDTITVKVVDNIDDLLRAFQTWKASGYK